MAYHFYYWVTTFISAAFLITSGYAADFQTFRIIPSDAVHPSRNKFVSSLNGELETSFYDTKDTESSEPIAEHRTVNMPINIKRNNQEKKTQVKLSVPYPYAHHSDLPKTLQIAVEPHQNDTKFKITDSFLDSLINPLHQPQSKSTTTKKPKKPNKNDSNKNSRPNKNQSARPNKNVKQNEGVEATTEEQDNTTNDPIMSQPSSVVQNNELTGSSQIGNRESQMILKPTVIVNIRGTVSNSEGPLALESRSGDIEISSDHQNKSQPRNVFHISQEINIAGKPMDQIGETYVEPEDIPTISERKFSTQERTFNFGTDERWLKERMSIFDDYSDFSLYR